MIHWLRYREQYGGIKTLLVIAKSIPGEDTKVMIRFFDRLLLRDHDVFTVVPDGCSPENFDYPEPIKAWHWSSLCSGGSSIDLYSSESSDDDDDSGSSSPDTDRAQGVKRESETDAAGSATQNVVQKETVDANCNIPSSNM